MKCWGEGQYGQTGYGDTDNRGVTHASMGDGLPKVDLGTDKTAKKIAAGRHHFCAILNDDTLKCWGRNGLSQLGYSDTNERGSDSSQMGDFLPAIDAGQNLFLNFGPFDPNSHMHRYPQGCARISKGPWDGQDSCRCCMRVAAHLCHLERRQREVLGVGTGNRILSFVCNFFYHEKEETRICTILFVSGREINPGYGDTVQRGDSSNPMSGFGTIDLDGATATQLSSTNYFTCV